MQPVGFNRFSTNTHAQIHVHTHGTVRKEKVHNKNSFNILLTSKPARS